MARVISFDFDQVYAYVERQAMKGVKAATITAVGNVKKHAPVRKLFRGTTYRTDKRGFRLPILRQVSTPGSAGASLDMSRGYKEKIGSSTREAGERIKGHSNSYTPLLRTRVGRTTVFLSGDFRRVSEGRLAKLEPRDVTAVEVRNGKATVVPVPKAISGADIRFAGGKALTDRGKYEIRLGRANFKSPDDGIVRVGGRLRAGIHAEGPVLERGVIWGYVVSDTKDPETGRLYPRDQEFGTSHNRPHPFMRPGLHDSRGALRRELREAIRRVP